MAETSKKQGAHLHLQTPRADTCTFQGTARADSGGSKTRQKKLKLKIVTTRQTTSLNEKIKQQ